MDKKADFVLYIKNSQLYLADVRTKPYKILTKESGILSFINMFVNSRIQSIDVEEKNMIVNFNGKYVQIAGYNLFFAKYKSSPFAQKICNYFIEQKKSEKKVSRENKHVGVKVVSLGVVASIMIAMGISAYGNSQENPTIDETTSNTSSYSSQVAGFESETKATEQLDFPEESTIVAENTDQLDFEDETTTKVETTTKKEETTISQPTTTNRVAGLSGYQYKNDYSDGFIVTTDNRTYQISAEDFDLMCAVVRHEAGENQDEALAVASVMLNRCDSSAWEGNTPREVITADNQFESYFEGYYRPFLNGNYPDSVRDAVSDALNGCRNNNYCSFRSNEATYYGNTMLTSSGNRYK